jgi:hypothetical protein
MIKAFGTTLTVAAAMALGAGAQAQATPAHHVKSHTHAQQQRAKACRKASRRHAARRGCKAPAKTAHTATGFLPLGLTSTDSNSATVTWSQASPASAIAATATSSASAASSTPASASVYVNSHLIDTVPVTGPNQSYDIPNLWPSSNYTVGVRLYNASGGLVARYARSVATGAQTGSVPRLYSPDAFINTPVGDNASVDPNSSGIVSEALVGYSSTANLANNKAWGIPVYQASSDSPSYNVGCLQYDCWFNYGPTNIPANAQPQTGSDGHMIVMQPNGQEFDMWAGQRDGNGWTAGEDSEESASGPAVNCTRVHGCGAADVAGFALGAGLIRPEEIAQGHIDHALAITTPDTRADYIACPATDTDGRHDSADALPIGSHVQLDPSVNVNALHIPRWQKVIAVALQQYGAYVIDTGGSVAFYAESNLDRPYNAWANAGVKAGSPSLSDLPWQKMRVLSMTQCGS